MKDIVKEQIKNLPVYETGKPIDIVSGLTLAVPLRALETVA